MDSLSTFTNLVQKNIRDDSKFLFCHVPNEDIVHVVFSCSKIRHIWDSYFPCLNLAHDINSCVDLLFLVLRGDKKMRGQKNEVAKVVCIAWGLWSCRNSFVYKGVII